MVKLVNILIILIIASNVVANNNFVTNKDDVITKMIEFKENPNSYIFDYTSSPKEIAINKNNIKSRAINKGYSDQNAITIRDNFDKRPQYRFNDGLLKESKTVITNSESIVNGISNEYVDCEKKEECKVVYEPNIKHCTRGNKLENLKCQQELNVTVSVPNKVTKRITVELRFTSKYSGSFSYDLRKQQLIAGSTPNVQVKQDNSISDLGCDNSTMRIIEEGYLPDTYNTAVTKSISLATNCIQPILNISIDQRDYHNHKYKTRGVYAIIEFNSEAPPVITESLISSCPEIDRRVKAGLCALNNNICLAPKETRVINGIAVERDCWLYQAKYTCGSNSTLDTCKTLESNNCIQVSSDCDNYLDGMCNQFKQGYKCPINHCTGKIALSCGDGQKINEVIAKYTTKANKEDADFATSITKLSVINDAVKSNPSNFTQESIFIFKGTAMKCQKSALGFKNCCKDNGWGVDVNLAQCSSDEKQLGAKKEEGLAIYVGENEHSKGGRVDKAYCVFDSKIAKLIQEYGRGGQLGISFGSGKYPDCRAISPIELAHINLDKIDLSKAFTDSLAKHKDVNETQAQEVLRAKIKQYYTDEVVND